MLRLGYPTLNWELRKKGILTARQMRLDGLERMKELFLANLKDTEKVIHWNLEHGILLYRMDSGMAPHISNPKVCVKKTKPNGAESDVDAIAKRDLAYDPRDIPEAVEICKRIGELARRAGMRLTFHPSPVNALSCRKNWKHVRADLLWQAIILDMIDGPEHVLVLHGGGTYGDKATAMKTWIEAYFWLPEKIRKYIVLENDESRYSILDVLEISDRVRARGAELPVVLDIFHHYVYQKLMGVRIPIAKQLHRIVRSWGKRRIKMHISEQRHGAKVGAHAEYVKHIPAWMLKFPKVFGDLDLMIESRSHEQGVLFLREKYGLK